MAQATNGKRDHVFKPANNRALMYFAARIGRHITLGLLPDGQ